MANQVTQNFIEFREGGGQILLDGKVADQIRKMQINTSREHVKIEIYSGVEKLLVI